MGFVDVDQCKRIISGYLKHSGRGGFMTGTVTALSPLTIQTESKLAIQAVDLYTTDSCIGLFLNLQHGHAYEDTEKDGESPTEKDTKSALRDGVVLRRPLAVGDGVLLLCRPDTLDGVKYILLDRIQPYTPVREVSAL